MEMHERRPEAMSAEEERIVAMGGRQALAQGLIRLVGQTVPGPNAKTFLVVLAADQERASMLEKDKKGTLRGFTDTQVMFKFASFYDYEGEF